MPICRLRKTLSLLLLGSGAIIVFSFGYAGYLLSRQGSRIQPAAGRAVTSKPEELLRKAGLLLKNQKVEQALVAYRGALARDPRSLRAQLGIAGGEYLAGREKVAAAEYERALKLDPTSRKALLELARIYSSDPRTWAKSEARYREYLRHGPDDAHALLGLARVLAWQGKASPAVDLYARRDVARLMIPADRRDYAFALVKSGRTEAAEPLLEKLTAQSPKDVDLRLQLAGIYAGRRDWARALPLYRSALAQRPADPEINLTYGQGLLAVRNYRAALAPLERARNARPHNAAAGLAFARALKGTGRLKKSSKEFQRVLPHYVRNPVIVREYADLLLERKNYRKASSYYQAAYDLGLRDTRLLVAMAGALSGCGKHKAALPYLEEAYRRAPTERLAFELAKLNRRLGRNERAMQLLKKVEASSRRRAGRS